MNTTPRYVMQVVAHEDDDLFFINPDVAAAIIAGLPTVTVYVTAGQRSGNGNTDGQRARNRQLGMMAAYAQMAGITTPQWTGDVLWSSGRQVEHYTLTNAPSPVELVFCNLPDSGLTGVDGGQTASTVLVDGGLVTRVFTYARADVITMLSGLLVRFQPSVVHVQDPLVDARYNPDHPDHPIVARWAGQAATGYSDSLVLVNYRCDNIGDVPVDLDPATTAAKTATANAYLTYDSGASTTGFLDRHYQRWPRGTTWVGRNANGCLQVFVVRSGQVWTWWQLTGGGWSAATRMGGPGPLAATLTVGPNADGRLQIFARRLDTHHIVSTWQTAVNGGWSSWKDMGTPNPATSTDQVGTPAAFLGTDGRIMLFLRNAGGGVSALQQSTPNGEWPTTWLDLGGTDVQDGVSASMNPNGCWEVVAATRAKILHWYQAAKGGPFIANNSFPAPVPASPPVAVRRPDGTVSVAYRAAGTAVATVNSQDAPAGNWMSPIAAGRAGVGAVAVAATSGPTLVSRDAAGHVAVGKPATGGSWAWTDLPDGPQIDAPAAAVNPDGTVTLVGLGFDGLVRVSAQSAPGGPFGPWQVLAS